MLKDFQQLQEQVSKAIQGMTEGIDYGVIPGTSEKKLLKSGADKLRTLLQLSPEVFCSDKVLDIQNGFILLTYKCVLRTSEGRAVADCEGSATSEETKFKYVWLTEEELPTGTDKSKLKKKANVIFASEQDVKNKPTEGNYGKPISYWEAFQKAIDEGKAKLVTRPTRAGGTYKVYEIESAIYRVKNPDIIGLYNNLQKIAQKRAFVAAVLMATAPKDFVSISKEVFDEPVVDAPASGIVVDDVSPVFEKVEGSIVEESPEAKKERESIEEVKACQNLTELTAVIKKYNGYKDKNANYKAAFELRIEELCTKDFEDFSSKVIYCREEKDVEALRACYHKFENYKKWSQKFENRKNEQINSIRSRKALQIK